MKFPFDDGPPDDLISFIKGLTDSIGNDKSSRVVLKEIEATPEWRSIADEFVEALKQSEELKKKAKSLQNLFWSTIERETGHFKDNMYYDGNRDIVVVYATDDDKKKLNASFFKKKDEPEEPKEPKEKPKKKK